MHGPAGMQVGPKLEINAKRQVVAAGKTLEGQPVPENQWLHVETRCRLGPGAPKTGRLRATPKDGSPLAADGLPCDERFEGLDWLGFMSAGTEAGVMFLDNLRLGPAEPTRP